jgi:hypothetical protein
MDCHPILSILLNQLQEQIGLLKTPRMFLNTVDEFGNQSIGLLLLVSLIFLFNM